MTTHQTDAQHVMNAILQMAQDVAAVKSNSTKNSEILEEMRAEFRNEDERLSEEVTRFRLEVERRFSDAATDRAKMASQSQLEHASTRSKLTAVLFIGGGVGALFAFLVQWALPKLTS